MRKDRSRDRRPGSAWLILAKMRRSLVVLVYLVGLLASGCDSGNPVAPPPPQPDGNGGGGTSGAFTVTVTADRTQLAMGSTEPARIRVTAKNADGTPAPDGTAVRINTSLGSFGSDAAGQPVQLVTRTLAGGVAEAELFAGDKTGVAVVLAQVGTSTGQLNLSIVTPSPKPAADFIFEVSNLTVLFTNASTGDPTTFAWKFGDGTTSTAENPLHAYAAAGTYSVTLTVTNSTGSSTKSKFVTVQAGSTLTASFVFETNGLNVLFTDTSTGEPSSWDWDFGDGRTSTARHPSHAYAAPGSYAVSLRVSNVFGVTSTASRFVTVSLGEAPQADFQFQADGLRVLVTDASTGSPTAWSWDFGDGGTSTARNPEHAYAQAGTYNVTLTASNAAGSSMKSKFVTVSLGDPPTADFEFQANGLRVVFLDRSTGSPTSWSWDFGDGGTSTEQNPVHTYAAPGTYTVILTAANAAGSSRASKLVTVGAASAPVARFCYQRQGLVVIFTDASTQSPTSWKWDFGDCETQGNTCMSTLQNPGHTYIVAGTYAVSLTATNAAGQSSRTMFVQVDPLIVDAGPVCP